MDGARARAKCAAKGPRRLEHAAAEFQVAGAQTLDRSRGGRDLQSAARDRRLTAVSVRSARSKNPQARPVFGQRDVRADELRAESIISEGSPLEDDGRQIGRSADDDWRGIRKDERRMVIHPGGDDVVSICA